MHLLTTTALQEPSTTGTYCVTASGIDASAPGSVAIVSDASGNPGAAVHWHSGNSACNATQFEVLTTVAGTVAVRNFDNSGTKTVSLPAIPEDAGYEWSIAIP